MRATLLGDPSMRRGLVAGLLDARVQAEVADELVRRAEAGEVADGGGDRDRDRDVDAGDRHQSPGRLAAQRDARELGVDQPQLLAVEVQLAQQRPDGPALVGGQLLLGQPAPTLDPEHIGGRAARHEVAMQDRLDLVLQPRALAHQMRAPGDLAPARLGVLVGDPHARQVVGGQQLREDLGIDLVGLDLGLGDRPRLLRVGHHNPRNPAGQQPHDRVRVPGRLQRDLVAGRQAVGEDPQRLRRRRDPPGLADQAVLPDRDLRELAMHIESEAPARHALTSIDGWIGEAVGGQDDTYGFALEAHPGKSQGRPPTSPERAVAPAPPAGGGAETSG